MAEGRLSNIVRTIALTLVCSVVAGQAAAQTKASVPPKSVVEPRVDGASVEEIQIRRDFLFKAMLQRPDDLDVAFEYAALSAKVGDLEAAISTLERMLIFAPGLPRLQLELGVLYYRLSAFETARSYFQSAISAPDVPPEVRARVEQYLAGIDEAIDPARFSGQVRAGIRYQTNANRATTDPTFSGGSLNAPSLGSPDGNVYATGVFHMSYALPSQGDSIEADLVTYVSKQFDREDLDVALAEVTIGPAFDMGRFSIDNASLGIYGIGSGVVLGGDFYSAAIGAGARFVIRPTPATSFSAALEYRHKDYHDSATSPAASLRDGDELRAVGSATYILSSNLALVGSAFVQRGWASPVLVNAPAFGIRGYWDFYSYIESGFSVGPRFSFASPISSEMPAWIGSISAGALFREYDERDPIWNIPAAEHDTEAFIGAGLTVPLKSDVALIADMEYRNVDSNYPVRNYDNFSISFSVAKSF